MSCFRTTDKCNRGKNQMFAHGWYYHGMVHGPWYERKYCPTRWRVGQMRVVLLECGNWEMCFSSIVADLTYDGDIKTDYIRVMLDWLIGFQAHQTEVSTVYYFLLCRWCFLELDLIS